MIAALMPTPLFVAIVVLLLLVIAGAFASIVWEAIRAARHYYDTYGWPW